MNRFTSLPVHRRSILLAVAVLALIVAGCSGGVSQGSFAPVVPSTATPPPAATLPPAASPMTGTVNMPGSASTGATLPFQSLAQGFKLGGGVSKPVVLVAVDAVSLAAIVPLVDGKHQASLKDVDLAKEIPLAAFWGTRPSGGSSITVSEVSLAGTELTVRVVLRENDPAVSRVDAQTLPYHLVTLRRDALPKTGDWSYRLMNGDAVLATGKLP